MLLLLQYLLHLMFLWRIWIFTFMILNQLVRVLSPINFIKSMKLVLILFIHYRLFWRLLNLLVWWWCWFCFNSLWVMALIFRWKIILRIVHLLGYTNFLDVDLFLIKPEFLVAMSVSALISSKAIIFLLKVFTKL